MTTTSVLSKAGHKVEVIDLSDGMKLFRCKMADGQVLSLKFESTGTLEGDRDIIRQALREDLKMSQRILSLFNLPLW